MNVDEALSLALNDFATDELCINTRNTSVSISYKRLAEMLNDAEEVQQVREGSGGVRSKRKLTTR